MTQLAAQPKTAALLRPTDGRVRTAPRRSGPGPNAGLGMWVAGAVVAASLKAVAMFAPMIASAVVEPHAPALVNDRAAASRDAEPLGVPIKYTDAPMDEDGADAGGEPEDDPNALHDLGGLAAWFATSA